MTPVQRTVTKTLIALLMMVGFTIALVPLYDVFCQITGLNGKSASQPRAVVSGEVDESRYVTVQFITRTGSGLPWRLEALNRQVRVHPGQAYEVRFAFVNHGKTASRGRAVPSVSPSEASLHLRKVTCFCFQEQRLEAGEKLELPMMFQLSSDLPEGIHTVTLAYTLYPVAEGPVANNKSTSMQGGDA
ncbi:cytochrome c oxidase assembly protein subunit 11 [Modicisalibacter ilicicola DSM 19980]|uniref:Cytochrome c oxidase assembly protein CtaG n=1 Tax=Modicisalibacter ilicicola DSM 19980 TaxID=1121942 RepID=A0A1M4X7G9_9GAMM|nr:cytochrome c oxidase assembly protein [Halomonas ilicicola]SHE89391.1 cytochrome c oxidase assembly protein subunit 11 [Halomonas ilicicola DSM 19980]